MGNSAVPCVVDTLDKRHTAVFHKCQHMICRLWHMRSEGTPGRGCWLVRRLSVEDSDTKQRGESGWGFH